MGRLLERCDMIDSQRVPPNSEEAERAVLGAMLVDAERAIGTAIEGGVSARSFYVPANEKIYDVMVTLHAAGRPVDLLTVGQKLKELGTLDAVGGIGYVESIVDATPTAASVHYWIEKLREKERLRAILTITQQTAEHVYRGDADAVQVLSHAMAGLDHVSSDVMADRRTNSDVVDDLMVVWTRAYETRQSGGEYLPGLRTPYRRFNEIMGGLQPGLHFIGGKSSAGKTSFVLNLCHNFLLDGHPGLIIQLDDTHEDVIGRLVAMMAGVSLPALSQGFAKRDQLEKIKTDTSAVIRAMPLHVVEECHDVKEARALARFYKARHGIKWLVIDYVQVLDADGNARDDERIRLGKIAAACKRMWKELRLPVIVVSQVAKNKDAEDDGLHADMSDLFGASELFHAATSVLILKPVRKKLERGGPLIPVEMPLDSTGHSKRQAVAGHIKKNKHGAKDCMVMFWALMRYFQFAENEMIEERGIWRQRTWDEDIEANAALLEAQKKIESEKPDWV